MTVGIATPPRAAEEKGDLGFGTVVSTVSRRRLLNPDGTFNVRRVGLPWAEAVSVYHSALTLSWPIFLGWVVAVYLAINAAFGIAFALCGAEALVGPGSQSVGGQIQRAFFFSVETFATIGYGNIAPHGLPAHLVMTVEALVGVLAQALITGLFFARFARPTAAITFSRRAVIAPFQGGRALMIRMANRRKAELTEVTASLTYSFVQAVNGQAMRQYRTLPLELSKVTFFPLTWTIVHRITPESPLSGLTAEQMAARDAEILVLFSGIDDTFSSTVHTRTSYKAEEIIWDHKFVNIFNPPDAEGVLSVDISRLDEATPAS